MKENNIQKQGLRERIDRIDEDMIDLLYRRLKLVKKITHLKFGEKITDKKREAEIMSKVKYKAKLHDIDEKFIENVWQLILINDRQVQKKILK